MVLSRATMHTDQSTRDGPITVQNRLCRTVRPFSLLSHLFSLNSPPLFLLFTLSVPRLFVCALSCSTPPSPLHRVPGLDSTPLPIHPLNPARPSNSPRRFTFTCPHSLPLPFSVSTR